MKTIVIAIDGNCGSGKSTLSEILYQKFNCSIFHMDDYYLPFSRRDSNWENIPAGNMDLERFKKEVLTPAKAGQTVCYQPYHCRTDSLQDGVLIQPQQLVIVEGSYSHHPVLADLYDYKIFLTCLKEEQKHRLLLREGDRFRFYEERWIPMEEHYYDVCQIKKRADAIFDTQEYAVYDELVQFLKDFLKE